MPYGVSKQKGRDQDWLKEKCRELVKKHAIVEFLAKVANGENVEQAVGGEGEVISIPASVRDRLRATELLLDRGFGKPDQAVDMNVTDVAQRPDKEELETTLRCIQDIAKRVGLAKGK